MTEVQAKAGIRWKVQPGAQAGEQLSQAEGDAGDTSWPMRSLFKQEKGLLLLECCRQILLG